MSLNLKTTRKRKHSNNPYETIFLKLICKKKIPLDLLNIFKIVIFPISMLLTTSKESLKNLDIETKILLRTKGQISYGKCVLTTILSLEIELFEC